jgi:hypothetical protein
MVTTEDKNMLSTNINNYNDRERKVLELYDDGKNTRDIAKELRMSLRDISIILRKNQISHGVVITDNNNDKSNSIANKKCTQAYRLCFEVVSMV